MPSVPYGTPGGGAKKNPNQVKLANRNYGGGTGGGPGDIWSALDPFKNPASLLYQRPQQNRQNRGGLPAGPSAHTVNSSVPSDRYDQYAAVVPQSLPEQQPTLMDFLQKALGMIPNQGGMGQFNSSPYDQQYSLAQQQGQQGSNALKEAYAALVARYAADLPGIQGNYDQAAGAINGASDQAVQDTNQGYGAAQASQMDMLKKLGIGDAAGVIVGSGNAAQNDQAHQLGGIAASRGSNLGANAENRATATTYNQEAGAAQGVAGATQQALLQQHLAQQLAAISGQKAQAQQQFQQQQYQNAGNGFSQALQLAQGLSSDYWGQQDRQNRVDQNAASLGLQQQKLQLSQNKPASIVDMLQQYLKQTGQNVDPATYAKLLSAFANAN